MQQALQNMMVQKPVLQYYPVGHLSRIILYWVSSSKVSEDPPAPVKTVSVKTNVSEVCFLSRSPQAFLNKAADSCGKGYSVSKL